jgi:hypothetical protein
MRAVIWLVICVALGIALAEVVSAFLLKQAIWGVFPDLRFY